MTKETEKTSLKKENRKVEILTAAVKVFCDKGYDRATIDEIADEANCSHGLLYHYFSTKEQIFNELFLFASKEFGNHFVRVTENETLTAGQKLKQILLSVHQGIENSQPFVYYFYFFITLHMIRKDLPPYSETKCGLQDKQSPPMKILRLIESGQKSKELKAKPNAIELNTLFWSIIQGLTLQKFFSFRTNHTLTLPSVETLYDLFKANQTTNNQPENE